MSMGVQPTPKVVQSSLIEDFVIVPIPISNPSVGTGLAVVAMPFYRLAHESPLSNTVVVAGLTSSGSWGIGAKQSTRLPGDRARLDGFLGYMDLRYRFYGVGEDFGKAGLSVPAVQRGVAFVPEVVARALGRLYLGVRYRAITVTNHAEQVPAAALQPFFAGQSDQTSSGIGAVATYDTRNHDMIPSAGWLVEFKSNLADGALGSDSNYGSYTLTANYYLRAGPAGVVALRGFACRTSAQTPLFDLCLFGSGTDLRGYEAGRYRDRAMAGAQVEYRFQLSDRWGAVAFGGAGKIGPAFSEMARNSLLPSAGAGLRWLASPASRVNLSLDYAIGKHSSHLYLYVTESF